MVQIKVFIASEKIVQSQISQQFEQKMLSLVWVPGMGNMSVAIFQFMHNLQGNQEWKYWLDLTIGYKF